MAMIHNIPFSNAYADDGGGGDGQPEDAGGAPLQVHQEPLPLEDQQGRVEDGGQHAGADAHKQTCKRTREQARPSTEHDPNA